jgi:hypothetical protein
LSLSGPTIRTATEQDIEPVLRLWEAASAMPSVTDTREGLLGLLASDPEALIVGECDGAVVAPLIAAWCIETRFSNVVMHVRHEGRSRIRGRTTRHTIWR